MAKVRIDEPTQRLLTLLRTLVDACDAWHEFQSVPHDPITLACENARTELALWGDSNGKGPY